VIGKEGLTIIHLTPPDIRHHVAFPCSRSIRKYSRYKINLHKCDTDHIWLLAGRIWRTTFSVTKQFYGVEKQNRHDRDATRRHLVTHLFQRKATHQKRYGRFRSFRLAAGLMGINAAQPNLLST
jgi:hypothetical protein